MIKSILKNLKKKLKRKSKKKIKKVRFCSPLVLYHEKEKRNFTTPLSLKLSELFKIPKIKNYLDFL